MEDIVRFFSRKEEKNGRMREMEFFERQGKNGQTEGVNARYIAERASLTGLTKGKRY